ncbi:hypothetical protein NS234_01840 [Microbacterium oxydans]|uniref:hypothetical protein n=1 Tax=Microbacterium oxydans TaxID=82380 RepID=UPI0007344772|nr:hypothetical protein [Microbacterium oxydans]KTR79136.1 hypothetical protein NS234_01840 [Microbacterium oxydans]
MTDNKKLIEEAAKAIWNAHASGLSRGYLAESPPHYSDSEIYARAALAVFEKALTPVCEMCRWEQGFGAREPIAHTCEKAHTPTDDERAIAVCIEIASTIYGGYDDAQGALSDIHMMLAPIAAGFHRSEVPEPSADDLIATRVGLALANTAWQEGASTMLRSVNEHDEGKPGDRKPWSAPVSPYSAPLLARMKTEPSAHDDACEADWGTEGQESPCRCSERAQGASSNTDLIAWHVEQVEALRTFTRSAAHLKAAMMHAATVRALRADAAETGGE